MAHTMRLCPNRLRWLFAAALLAAVLFPPASALTTRELRIEKFDAEITVMPDSSIDVTEKIQAHFIGTDRKSTRLNSSHQTTSYAAFSFKKKIPPPTTYPP